MLRKTQDGGRALHANVPVLCGITNTVRGDIIQDDAPWFLRFPSSKSQLIGEHQRQLAALERPRNGGAANLLPIGPSLFVSHEEILVIDTSQVKRQPQTGY